MQRLLDERHILVACCRIAASGSTAAIASEIPENRHTGNHPTPVIRPSIRACTKCQILTTRMPRKKTHAPLSVLINRRPVGRLEKAANGAISF